MMRATPILVALAALAASSVAAHGFDSRGRGFLSLKADMQPEVVARTLIDVEDAWVKEVKSAISSNATGGNDQSDARASFEKSCNTIVSAVVQASSGDRATVTEYMGDVCGVSELSGWRQEQCRALASAITDTMSADDPANRDTFDASNLCHAYWSSFLMEEGKRFKEERAEQAASEKKRQEEAEQKAAEERAAEAKQEAAELEAKKAEAQNSTAPAVVTNSTRGSNSSTAANATQLRGARATPQIASRNTTEPAAAADRNATEAQAVVPAQRGTAEVTNVSLQNVSNSMVNLAAASKDWTPVNSSKASNFTVTNVVVHNVSEAVVKNVSVVGANISKG